MLMFWKPAWPAILIFALAFIITGFYHYKTKEPVALGIAGGSAFSHPYGIGAIAKALGKTPDEYQQLKADGASRGIIIWEYDVERYKKFVARMEVNLELASAIKAANEKDVRIFFADDRFPTREDFHISRTGYVIIVAETPDKEIIAFLHESIETAAQYRTAYLVAKKDADSRGIYIVGERELGWYLDFRKSLDANEKLADACATAKDHGVIIWLGLEFKTEYRRVTLDMTASDEEIIEFLIGKEK